MLEMITGGLGRGSGEKRRGLRGRREGAGPIPDHLEHGKDGEEKQGSLRGLEDKEGIYHEMIQPGKHPNVDPSIRGGGTKKVYDTKGDL